MNGADDTENCTDSLSTAQSSDLRSQSGKRGSSFSKRHKIKHRCFTQFCEYFGTFHVVL